ncbi:MAG: Highly acidic protein [uncultured Sulfurovum sp.]|uniref:Highly acidic protein n=1 Tax=uncultured Sulfurovum sp. TaxID=269237 RepID=A0A6S6U310_9BACT|nr:MAG: Highly acidic protein [uncultured Sulfurovum sp.]
MKILLINNNPVVSRLTALSARKEDVEIDEIQEVTELSSDTYDIVFVDADSWSKDVRDVISDNIKTQKSVLFYSDGDEDEKASFDLSILKPFLPSEVSAVIRSIDEEQAVPVTNENSENHFNVLDETKVSERDELFDLDALEEKKEEVSETVSASFDEKLEEAFPLKINNLDDDLFDLEPKVELEEKETPKTEAPKEALEEPKEMSNELFDLDLSDELPSLDDDLFGDNKKEEKTEVLEELSLTEELVTLEDEVKDDSLLALEIDDDKVEEISELEIEEKEPQVLDKVEIDTIKGILTEDIDSDMKLDDLMTPPLSVGTSLDVVEDKEETKVETVSNIDSGVLAQTLSAMPVEALRELLAGAKVNIKIKFPKSKK